MVLYQKGEYRAFAELYGRHSGKVYGYLRTHLSNAGEADDLLQSIFMKLHEHRARYDKSLPFLPWLFSIARNAVIDSLRKKRPLLVESSVLEKLPADSREDEMSREKELEAAVSSLPEAQRELIRLRFKEGLSFDEIAQKLEATSPSIRKRVSRGLQAIRKLVGTKNG